MSSFMSSSQQQLLDTRLHCVYLLTSLDPKCKNYFYIGYTTNPLRRLRQHNGLLTNGAWQTSRRGRPWTLVCFVSGFPEDRMGLKFEWCWQHPHKAIVVRNALQQASPSNGAATKVLSRLHRAAHAVAVLHILLRCELFQQLPLRVNVVDGDRFDEYCASIATATKGSGGMMLFRPLEASLPLLTVVRVTEADILKLLPNNGDDEERDGGGGGRGGGTQPDSESVISGGGGGGASSMCMLSQSCASNGTAAVVGRTAAFLTESRKCESGRLACSLCTLPITSVDRMMVCQRDGGHPGSCSLRCHITCMSVWFQWCSNGDNEEQRRNLIEGGTRAGDGDEVPPPTPPLLLTQHSTNQQLHDPHVDVAAVSSAKMVQLIPTCASSCPLCGFELHWGIGVQQLKQRLNASKQAKLELRRKILDEQLNRRMLALEEAAGSEKQQNKPHRRRVRSGDGAGGRNVRQTAENTTAIGGVVVAAPTPVLPPPRERRDHAAMQVLQKTQEVCHTELGSSLIHRRDDYHYVLSSLHAFSAAAEDAAAEGAEEDEEQPRHKKTRVDAATGTHLPKNGCCDVDGEEEEEGERKTTKTTKKNIDADWWLAD